jgi:hypothetical protein
MGVARFHVCVCVCVCVCERERERGRDTDIHRERLAMWPQVDPELLGSSTASASASKLLGLQAGVLSTA